MKAKDWPLKKIHFEIVSFVQLHIFGKFLNNFRNRILYMIPLYMYSTFNKSTIHIQISNDRSRGKSSKENLSENT